MHSSSSAAVLDAVRELAGHDGCFVLAISGGLDSMVLLDSAARVMAPERLTVATFDHGTGDSAARAAAHVAAVARGLGVDVVTGGGHPLPPTEAAWRSARRAFLRGVATSVAAGATPGGSGTVHVVTAHTADDQVETVLMRAMRGAGARGLAALFAPGDVRRPFVRLTRAQVATYALQHAVEWIEDPSNASMRFLRNRLRHDVIPALSRARPALVPELLGLSSRAAEWRVRMDELAERCCPSVASGGEGLSVAAADLVGYDPSSLAVLWSSIAGRVGVALSQRGTRRLVAFTRTGTPGGVMPLSGGWQVVRRGGRFSLERTAAAPAAPRPLPLTAAVQWGVWWFRPDGEPTGDAWSAVLPADRPLAVRSWEPPDRVEVGTGLVRVKRMLTQAGIAAADRVGWPVVVAGDEIVWIPGVSRASAATARSGRPGVCIRCEPSDDG